MLNALDESELGEFAARYYTVSGVIALKKEDFLRAKEDFQAAVVLVSQGQEGPEVGLLQLYIAQSNVALKEYAQAVQDLSSADQSGEEYWVLLSTAHTGLKDAETTFVTVVEGRRHFPDHLGLALKEVEALLWLEMHRQAFQFEAALCYGPT